MDAIQGAVDDFNANRAEDEETGRVARKELRDWFDHKMVPIKDAVLRGALARAGLEIAGGPINIESITQAINDGPLAEFDVEISNIFNKRELREVLEKVAIQKVAEQLGLKLESNTTEGVKLAIVDLVKDEVGEQLASEAGDIFDAAIPTAKIVAMIRQAIKEPRGYHTNVPTVMDEKAQKNREKQARYRAKNRRDWFPKVR
ncbi:hypothetical protein [Comamonas sp. GB3 AK4-5]|uniref:hypothetical protein n=1 Tax=Comamonas sp. GB3 AK4-5 TaxID=3231487 RepID=UPI00351E3AE0